MKRFILRAIRHIIWKLEIQLQVLRVKCNYAIDLQKVLQRAKGRKIKVIFLVNELAKWKTQSLFDLMDRSESYEPYIGLTLANIDWGLSYNDKMAKYEANKKYFLDRGMRILDAYDFNRGVTMSLEQYEPDIVWYQQPWDIAEVQRPDTVSRYAITGYIPYFVQNYGSFGIDYNQVFHRELWRCFIVTKQWERYFRRKCGFLSHAGKLLGLGHTALDALKSCGAEECKGYVVYAPHWSIDCPGNENFENYSTFLWTGKPILEYAKAHPEIKWVFKPHPTLKSTLKQSKIWSTEEVDAYYEEWGRIGTKCETCDYQRLMMESAAMVTDCGSFLTEYFSTGKPLVHLISPTCKLKPLPPAQKMFNSFYKVHSMEELETTLEMLIGQQKDPKREERLALVRKLGIGTSNVAANILQYLSKELRIDSKQ